MSASDKFFAIAIAISIVVALVATALFWIIKGGFDADKRDDRLQEQCIAKGGNWSNGCEMKP